MNVRRGFFRVWVVLSAASVAIVFWVSYPQIKDQFEQRISHDIPMVCNLSRGKIEADFYALDKNTPPVPDGFELEQSSVHNVFDKFDDLIPGNICWYHPAKFRSLFPEYNDLSDDALRVKLYKKANPEHTLPHPWKLLFSTIIDAAIFPLVALGLWFITLWLVLGFRSKKLI